MAFSAVANGGLLMKPRLVQRVTNARGEEVYSSEPLVVRRVLSASVAAETLSALQGVVDDPRGTGKNCRMEKWTSWGKTGTAQIPGPQGYIPDAYTGSFVGGAPAGKPAVVCLISIYWPDRSKGYYGGTVAAPYVRDVLEQTLEYLDIPSDRLDPPTVASGP
jgi:stage V sporulation protein D (sporulation-specific penicillin-binding protein)